MVTKNKAINNTAVKATTYGLDQLCNWIYMNSLTVLLLKLNSLDRGSESGKVEADSPEELCEFILSELPRAYAPSTKLFVRGYQSAESYNNPYCTVFQLDRDLGQQNGIYGAPGGNNNYMVPNNMGSMGMVPREWMEREISHIRDQYEMQKNFEHKIGELSNKLDENRPAIEQYMPVIQEVKEIFKLRAMEKMNQQPPGINGVGIATNEPALQKEETMENKEQLLQELESLHEKMNAAEKPDTYNKAVQETIERSIFILAESIQADVLAEKLRHLAVKSLKDPARFKMMMDLI